MKKKRIAAVLGLALAGALALAGCRSNTNGAQVPVITAEEAKAMMDKGGVTVVDVRTAEEYAGGHIPGAVLVPLDSITEGEMPQALPDQDATLLIYCRSGRRSSIAANTLAAAGYTAVYDFGGINDWPYDTVEGDAP